VDDIGSVNSAAGYRLVRRLGSARRADVFLGHASIVTDAAADSGAMAGSLTAGSATAGPVTAAIKLFRPGTDRSGIDAEIGALARASSPHLMRLVDLATAQDGLPVLVLGLLRPQPLARLLASRGRIGSGEAVTILAPIAAAVAELHRVGVAHGAVTAGSVLFDELGTPVLASFGQARIIGEQPVGGSAASLSPAALAASAPALRDLADLADLANVVLESTPESAGRARVLSFLRSTDPSRAPERFAADLSAALFDSAPASAVVLDTAPHGSPGTRQPVAGIAAAAIRDSFPAQKPDPANEGTRSAERGRRRARPAWLDALHLPEWLEDVVRASRPSRTAKGRLPRMLAGVRRPVWVGAASVAVLLTTALVLVPGDDASSGVQDADGGTVAPAGAAPDEPGPAPSVGAAEPNPERSAVVGDDPVAAALALLELRDGCLTSLSVLCLDGVDQVGSAAWEADGFLVRQAQEGGGAPFGPSPPAAAWDGRSASLDERMGDSALVTVAPLGQVEGEVPVSVLLIKGVEGWRIRDLFVG